MTSYHLALSKPFVSSSALIHARRNKPAAHIQPAGHFPDYLKYFADSLFFNYYYFYFFAIFGQSDVAEARLQQTCGGAALHRPPPVRDLFTVIY